MIVSDSLKGRVRCGGAAYWAITLGLVPLTGAVSLVIAWVLVRNYGYKTRGGHDLPVGEVRQKGSRDAWRWSRSRLSASCSIPFVLHGDRVVDLIL